MPAAPLPADEAERLATLAFLGFDAGAPRPLHLPAFDRAARLAAAIFGGRAELNLLGADRAFTVADSAASPGACASIARADSPCAHTLLDPDGLWCEDVRLDPRLCDSALAACGLRFYAGAPLTVGGRRMGALCVSGLDPRPYDRELADQLAQLAALVSEALELRLSHDALQAADAARRDALAERDTLLDLPVTLVLLDLNLRISRCSRQWISAYLGEGAASPVGRTLPDLLPDTIGFHAVFLRAREGETTRGETPFPGPDGVTHHWRYECAPWRGPDGTILGVSILSFEVTELVEARLAAERSESRLQLALGISESIVWELEPGRDLVVAGDLHRFFGPTCDMQALGRDLFTGVHPDDRAAIRAAWRRHVEHGEPYAVEYRMSRPDGREIWVAATSELRPSVGGAPRVALGVAHDITARKLAELAQTRAAAAAEAASRAKSEFLANMSHELRTPLNGVMGVAGALGRTGLDDDQRDMVGLIETSARALERLLSDVLDLAKIESRAFELEPEPVDVAAFVRGVGTLFQWRARDKGLRFECAADPALAAPRLVDETRLRQILGNLLSNAIKFTEGGRVSLGARLEGEAVVFEVSDTGIGFSDAARDRLFERFEQADGSITRRYGGTGLGLAISRSLAERMGGALEAASREGEGSTFTLRLPLATCEAALPAAAVPVAAAVARSAPVRVLLAEDHPVNRRVVELILAGAAIVTSVENGAEALEALAAQAFDLVLMDMQMPVMDGLTAMRALREREAASGAPRTPVLALTANAGVEQAAASRAAGADEHLAKPVSADRLLDAVRRLAAPEAAPKPAAQARRAR